jgi:hypothetical protein
VGGVVGDGDGAEGVPAPAVLDDLLKEAVGGQLVAPVEEEEDRPELGAEQALPGEHGADILGVDPGLEAAARAGELAPLDLDEEVEPGAVDDKIEVFWIRF